MFQLKSDNAMDEEQCGMYDPEEDDELDEVDLPPGELTENQKENIKDLYKMFDIDNSGTLTFTELRKGLQVLGLNPTVREVKQILKKHDVGPSSKGNKKVTYDIFEEIMKEELLCHTNNEFDLLEAFKIFDRDKNGTLDRDELKRCLTCLGECLTDKEVDELFEQLDTDRSGSISVMEASKLLA